MPRAFYIISILLTTFLSSLVFADRNGIFFRYLKEPAVKWENNVFTGELKNVPVKGLLEELLRKEGSNWEVIGDLKGTLDISFDDMTIDDSIKKIMRLGHYNFTLIFDRDEHSNKPQPHRIKYLTIYQKDQIIRFSRTSEITHTAQKKPIRKTSKKVRPRTTAVSTIPKNLNGGERNRTTLPSGPTEEEMIALNEEIKAFADEMLAAKKITQEEYNELIGEMEK